MDKCIFLALLLTLSSGAYALSSDGVENQLVTQNLYADASDTQSDTNDDSDNNNSNESNTNQDNKSDENNGDQDNSQDQDGSNDD